MLINKKSYKASGLLLTTILFYSDALSAQVLKAKSSGRKPASQVTYRQSGVPAFDLVQKKGNQVFKVKEIPKLDIGEEKQVEAADFQVKIPENRELKLDPVRELKSPQMVQLPVLKLLPVTPAKSLVDKTKPAVIPEVQELAIVPDPVVTQPNLTAIANLVEISPDEYKMLQALIFLEYQKKYDLAMSLFVELMEKPEYRSQALYHYAETAFGLGLYSEFRQKMIQVSQETKNMTLKKMATESLVKNISALENSDIGLIDPLVEAFDINVDSNEVYLLKKAKYHANRGELGQLESALTFIPTTSKLYPEAQLLKSVLNYRQGQVDTAITDLEVTWPLVQEDKKSDVRNLSALTLARLYFQKGEYKKAYDTYIKIDKASPHWLQAMVETAWTQILAGDHEGAAGNMFSLHTDFFKKAYAPETYIVRTVGYLNLCQYGDGMSVLNDLKKRYQSTHEKLAAFQEKNKEADRYYELVRTWLKNVDQTEVEGLPRAFIVELARHPSYTKVQKQINNYEDENNRFNKITVDLIRKEKEARLAMLKAKNKLAVLKREKASTSAIESADREFMTKGIEHVIVSRAREGIKKMRLAAIDRLDNEKQALRDQASKALQARYNEHMNVLNNLIDQREVLAYEIYSGAGEHIRFQMAGGEIKDRAPAALAPEEKESYKWKFKGEVWEDEIGHYRSSLKSVCPTDDIAQNGGL